MTVEQNPLKAGDWVEVRLFRARSNAVDQRAYGPIELGWHWLEIESITGRQGTARYGDELIDFDLDFRPSCRATRRAQEPS